MRTTRALRSIPAVCLVFASLACACNKKLTAEAIEGSSAAIVQKGKLGTSTWVVAPDGTVNAVLKDPSGKPITQGITGQVTFAAPGGAPATIPVQVDPQSGVLTAQGPKLDADITPVSFAFAVDGKPWNGSIDVPRAGTQDLVATAKLQAPLPPGTLGPNGGVVQMVGPDRVELVANRSNGDVRAYVLDADDRPIDPGDRKITIALQGDAPEVIALEPEPQAHFFIGHVRRHFDPTHVTVAVNVHGATHAGLVGWAPGSVVVVGPEAPRVHLFAVDAWPGDVVELHGRHGHHGEVVVGGPEVIVGAPGVFVGPPGVVVGGPGVVVEAPVLGPPRGVIGGPVVVTEVGRGHEREEREQGGGGGHHGH